MNRDLADLKKQLADLMSDVNALAEAQRELADKRQNLGRNMAKNVSALVRSGNLNDLNRLSETMARIEDPDEYTRALIDVVDHVRSLASW